MDEHTTNIVAIAASLTEAEREALRLFKDRKWVFSDNTPGFHSLFTRRMVVRDFDGLLPAWYFELTDLGSAVLAALDSVATAQPETNRKTIITAFTFYDENYERKIREGLCKVYDMVGDIVVAFKGLDDYVHLETIDKITGKPRVDGFMRSQLLTAVWLPTAPAQVTEAAQSVAGEETVITNRDDSRDVAISMRNERIATLGAELATLRAKLQAERTACEAAVKALGEVESTTRQALREISELAGGAQGEWVSVQPEYAPMWANEFKEIEARIESVWDKLGWERGMATKRITKKPVPRWRVRRRSDGIDP